MHVAISEPILVILGFIFLPFSYLIVLIDMIFKGRLWPLHLLPDYGCGGLGGGWSCYDSSQLGILLPNLTSLITFVVMLVLKKPKGLLAQYLIFYLGTLVGVIVYLAFRFILFPEPTAPELLGH